MTRNLNTVIGLGHFMLLLTPPGAAEPLQARLQRLLPAISGGKVPPAVHAVGGHALIASWGGALVDRRADSTVVGVFQRARYDCPGVDAARLHGLFARGTGTLADAEQLRNGNFTGVAVHAREPRAMAWTAPFRQLPLYRATAGGMTLLATDARLATEMGVLPRELDEQALYHYLNYSCIPAPFAVFRGLRKVPAGTRLRATPGNTVEECYWRPRFEGDRRAPLAALEEELREEIHGTVRAHRPAADLRWGTFLSGGTDSSSITGVLAREPGAPPVRTYSIGFGEEGYDELEFARIAAEHFGTRASCRRVDEQDTLAAIPKLLEAYDEPYGNASAVPTYYCAASAAADGVQLLLAGDGGDESFGGNERYAKNAVYRQYARLPRRLRAGIATLAGAPARGGSLFANRLRHFARRGALPNPDRFYREEAFASEHFDALLGPGFRARVARESSLELMRHHYESAGCADELHRLMYVDLMMAIADNDLIKVQRASQAAGVCVTYPYLDSRLVDFTGRLHASLKVRRLKKRFLFKRALRELLPPEILSKRKQGFGLPIALWARGNGAFSELLNDTLRSRRAAERGLFEQDFIEQLLDAHARGGWDFSPELWRLLMLELWQREYADAA